MSKRALLVGIDRYKKIRKLSGCVADAREMAKMLEKNEDGSPNYRTRLITSAEPDLISSTFLKRQWQELFNDCRGNILFYFSGHGALSDTGGYLVVQDGTVDEPGLPMNDLLLLANRSKAQEVLLILDCCFAGNLGDPANLKSSYFDGYSQLREGVTILAASRPENVAREANGHGVFTNLILGALSGGGADVRGRVSAASVYACAEQTLGEWDQRPLYKSYASRLSPIRQCEPLIADSVLRELTKIFPRADSKLRLNPSYEPTDPSRNSANVKVFKKLKLYRNARLLQTVNGEDLFYAAIKSKRVQLTPLGRFYWQLVERSLI